MSDDNYTFFGNCQHCPRRCSRSTTDIRKWRHVDTIGLLCPACYAAFTANKVSVMSAPHDRRKPARGKS